PQQIVATRLLYCLQHPVPIQVVCKGFTPVHMYFCYSPAQICNISVTHPKQAHLWFTNAKHSI
ncbi:hypothetical protein FA14DRAFT_127425, partial [Meira miltonrushii]